MLKHLKRQPAPAAAVASPFVAALDTGLCVGCGTCQDRCQMDALTMADALAVLNTDRCIGCGLCVSTCSGKSLVLVRKPEAEQRDVPATFRQTYVDMARQRGKLKPVQLARAWIRTKIK